MEDFDPPPKNTPIGQLIAEDLDPLSQDELQERVAVLQIEIQRTQARMAAAQSHRSSADALFKK